MNDRSEVKNVADEKQVKKAKMSDEQRRRQELNDLASILQEPHGRRFIWRLLERCNVFESIQRQSAEIHYLSGQRDVGLFLMSEVTEADQIALFKMMLESSEKKDAEYFKNIVKRLKEEF